MGYAQWITINLINSMASGTLSVANAVPNVDKGEGWGKFYRSGNKDEEIKASEINRIKLPPNSSTNINSCGRSDSASGTTGHIDLYDGDTKICRVFWNCPWGSKVNEFGTSERTGNGYWIDQGEFNRDSGAIGAVHVEIGKKG